MWNTWENGGRNGDSLALQLGGSSFSGANPVWTQEQLDAMTPEERQMALGTVAGVATAGVFMCVLIPVLVAVTIITVVWLVQRRKSKQGR